MIKNDIDNVLKTKTKLDNNEKIILVMYAINIIFTVITAVKTKNTVWILCAALWGFILIMEYFNKKLIKLFKAEIEINEQYIQILKRKISEDYVHKVEILELVCSLDKDIKKNKNAEIKSENNGVSLNIIAYPPETIKSILLSLIYKRKKGEEH